MRQIPERRKGFYKFCWDQDLDTLNEASLEANLIWKAAGKPRHGPFLIKDNPSACNTASA